MNSQKNSKDFILSEVLRLLNERYEIGMYEFLFKFHYPVFEKIRMIEDTITNDFDNMSISELKNILADYWKLHVASIKKYKSEGQLNFNADDIKKQINNELNIL